MESFLGLKWDQQSGYEPGTQEAPTGTGQVSCALQGAQPTRAWFSKGPCFDAFSLARLALFLPLDHHAIANRTCPESPAASCLGEFMIRYGEWNHNAQDHRSPCIRVDQRERDQAPDAPRTRPRASP